MKFYVYLFSLLSLSPLLGLEQTPSTNPIQSIVEAACPKEKQKQLLPKLTHIAHKSPIPWQGALKASLYISCFLDYPPWKAAIAFQLALVGQKTGFSDDILSGLTELLSVRSFGKKKYKALGRLWQKLQKLGESSENIQMLLAQALQKGLSTTDTTFFAIAYAQERSQGQEVEVALQKALLKVKKRKYKKRRLKNLKNQDDFWELVESNIPPARLVIDLEKKPAWDSQKLQKFVEKWLGVPYLYGGDSRQGIDCSAFVARVIRSQFTAKKLPRSARGLSQIGHAVSKKSLLPGDLLFFAASPSPNKITHVGIYLGQGVFAHASSSKGVTKSQLESRYYQKRLVKVVRLVPDS